MMNLVKELTEKFNKRYINNDFKEVENKLTENVLNKIKLMFERDGEPEIIIYNDLFIVVEMSSQTPNQRSICYDKDARINRKKFPPETSALELASRFGLEVVDEEMYQYLQTLKRLDTKTSSWLKTNKEFRKLGGALTGEFRYNRVFIYHNGADSYYSSRSFRAYLVL